MNALVLWLWLAGVTLAVAFRLTMAVRSGRRAAAARGRAAAAEHHGQP